MKLNVQHSTTYQYDEKVAFTPHKILLRPREDPHIRVCEFHIQTFPQSDLKWSRDAFENSIATAYFTGESRQLLIQAGMTVELLQDNPFDFIIEPYAATHPFQYNGDELEALQGYLSNTGMECASLDAWIQSTMTTLPDQTLQLLTTLNRAIYEKIQYRRREESGVQSPDETLRLNSGSCRDLASLFMAACHSLGLATRYVSGYLYAPEEPGKSSNRAAGSMHAWAEVYLPGAGWKGFDPTNGVLATNFFIPVAVSTRPAWTSPIQGAYSKSHPVDSQLIAEVSVTRLE
ncbi:MAG: transglutaminase family protein [Methylacidiphilales bacterium]|nr:transglutaminase family protein [Candidatus Methylacidiphilales bacterium]